MEIEKQTKKKEFSYFKIRMYALYYRVRDIPRDIKYFFQRGFTGCSDKDSWNFDIYASRIICKGLKKIRKNLDSHPNELTFKEWKDVINHIIWTFETAEKIADGDIYIVNTARERARLHKLFDSKDILNKEDTEKFKKGFKLFNKWFFDFCD